MKKLLLSGVAVFALIPAAYAETSSVFKPYVGFDLQHTSVSYNENINIGGGLALNGESILEDGLNGFNIHAGNRFNDHIGLELGYFRTREESKNTSNGATVGPGTVATADFSTDVKMQGFTLDAMGYLPLGAEEPFELIGTAGLSWTKAELEMNVPGVGNASSDDSEIGFRAGAGAQLHLTDKVNVRGLARYQTADFDDVVDNAWTYTVGLNCSF